MSFTDDDLKQLKNRKKPRHSIGPKIVDAIIARMEAAENVCNELETGYDTWTREKTKFLIEQWRKAAGK